MRSTTAIFRTCSAWWPTCWTKISGTSAPSGVWRGEFGSTPPFDIGPDALVVGYSLWAEMTCFLVLGWRFPVHVYDLHTAFLATSNILLPYNPDEVRKKPRKRLSDACRAYGIEGWENIDKPDIAKAIGEGRWREYGREAVLQYCEEDVRASAELLRRQLARPRQPRSRRSRARHALERLQRQDRRPNSGARACRSTCRCGTSCRRTSWRSLAR